MHIITMDEYNKDDLKNIFNEIRQKRIPTVIKKGVNYFPNLYNWDKTYIINKFGNNECNYTYDSRPAYSNLKCNYKDYFNIYHNNTYSFTRKTYDINDKHKFIDELHFPNPFFLKTNIDKYIFYSGPEYTGSLPHSHGEALNLMVSGQKKWILFDRNDIMGDRLQRDYYNNYGKHKLWIDWYNNEYENLKKSIKIVEYTQEPNDIIYIPYDYSHTVFNNKETMGIIIEII